MSPVNGSQLLAAGSSSPRRSRGSPRAAAEGRCRGSPSAAPASHGGPRSGVRRDRRAIDPEPRTSVSALRALEHVSLLKPFYRLTCRYIRQPWTTRSRRSPPMSPAARGARAVGGGARARLGRGARDARRARGGPREPDRRDALSLASVLGITLADLLVEAEAPAVHVVRAGEGPRVSGAVLQARLLRQAAVESARVEMYELHVAPRPPAPRRPPPGGRDRATARPRGAAPVRARAADRSSSSRATSPRSTPRSPTCTRRSASRSRRRS